MNPVFHSTCVPCLWCLPKSEWQGLEGNSGDLSEIGMVFFFSLSPVFSVGCNQFIFEVSLSEALPPLSSFCVLASVRQQCRPRVSVPETQLFLGGRPMQGTWGTGSVDRTFWLWGSSHVFSLFLLVVKQKCLPPNWSETWVVEWGLA